MRKAAEEDARRKAEEAEDARRKAEDEQRKSLEAARKEAAVRFNSRKTGKEPEEEERQEEAEASDAPYEWQDEDHSFAASDDDHDDDEDAGEDDVVSVASSSNVFGREEDEDRMDDGDDEADGEDDDEADGEDDDEADGEDDNDDGEDDEDDDGGVGSSSHPLPSRKVAPNSQALRAERDRVTLEKVKEFHTPCEEQLDALDDNVTKWSQVIKGREFRDMPSKDEIKSGVEDFKSVVALLKNSKSQKSNCFTGVLALVYDREAENLLSLRLDDKWHFTLERFRDGQSSDDLFFYLHRACALKRSVPFIYNRGEVPTQIMLFTAHLLYPDFRTLARKNFTGAGVATKMLRHNEPVFDSLTSYHDASLNMKGHWKRAANALAEHCRTAIQYRETTSNEDLQEGRLKREARLLAGLRQICTVKGTKKEHFRLEAIVWRSHVQNEDPPMPSNDPMYELLDFNKMPKKMLNAFVVFARQSARAKADPRSVPTYYKGKYPCGQDKDKDCDGVPRAQEMRAAFSILAELYMDMDDLDCPESIAPHFLQQDNPEFKAIERDIFVNFSADNFRFYEDGGDLSSQNSGSGSEYSPDEDELYEDSD